MADSFKGLSSYSLSIRSGISYGDMSFKAFSVREVYIDGKQEGEFHVKPNDEKNPAAAVLYLKRYFAGSSVGLADPSGLLSLEYPIYIICNPMTIESIPQIFEQIDEEMYGGTVPEHSNGLEK